MSCTKLPPVSDGHPVSLISTLDCHQITPKPTELFKGPSYTLNDSNVQHQLPPPKTLRPYLDRTAGTVDTWPAHAAMPFAPASQDAKSMSKPKFLQRLETFLQKELRALGCVDPKVMSEKRLQAFREVFEYLIEDFKTYRPLLASIKSEYEAMLNKYRNEIREMEPLKAMLVNVNEKCEQKILDLQQEEKDDMVMMKKENDRLNGVIQQMKADQMSLEEQVRKCQEEIAHEYKRYRDESDARKLLIQDINDLKYQQDEAKRALAGMSEDEEMNNKKEDPVMLRIALRKAREDIDLKTQKLAEVMADYGDVVPRRDYEMLENKMKTLEVEYEEMKRDRDVLHNDHSTLIETHKKIIEQRDKLSVDCEKLRRSATPRPDWSHCCIYIEGGHERWNEISAESSSSEKVDLLLAEMTGQDLAVIKAGSGGAVEFFEGKGLSESIPKHLRATGQIRNRRLGRRDAAIMIKEVWQEKIQQEGSKPMNEKSYMSDFLHGYLTKRFGVDSMVVEWGYNLQDAVTRFNFDARIKLFGGILNGELDESIYYDQLSRLEALYKLTVAADPSDTGSITASAFQECLQQHFNCFNEQDITSLVEAAYEELSAKKDDPLQYKELFTEDDEGRTGPFISTIQELEQQDKTKYIKEIEEAIGSASEVSFEDVRNVFQTVDPSISDSLCEMYVTRGFNLSMEHNKQGVNINKDELLKNLQSASIRRTSKR